MATCDPGNIHDTIKMAKEAQCRISVIGLAAEVYICRQIVEVSLPCVLTTFSLSLPLMLKEVQPEHAQDIVFYQITEGVLPAFKGAGHSPQIC